MLELHQKDNKNYRVAPFDSAKFMHFFMHTKHTHIHSDTHA